MWVDLDLRDRPPVYKTAAPPIELLLRDYVKVSGWLPKVCPVNLYGCRRWMVGAALQNIVPLRTCQQLRTILAMEGQRVLVFRG